MNESVDQLEANLSHKRERPKLTIPSKDLLSTGSTLINLACSGRVSGGFAKGLYYLLVGDTNSGKSLLTMNCLAEAAISPNFKEYRFICDNPEGGVKMDVGYYFGRKAEERIEPPAKEKDGTPRHSSTVEEFYYNLDDAFKAGKPFIYILDSADTLYSEADEKKFQKQKAAHARKLNPKNKAKDDDSDVAGNYGLDKPKIHSRELRKVVTKLAKTGSILIVVNQTRDKIGSFVKEKTRAGGNALEFWATIQIWFSIKERLKKKAGKIKKDRKIGILSKVHVKRTRITGKDRVVYVPIYDSVGIDDVGSMVDYLISEGHWESEGVENPSVTAPEFEFDGKKEALIQKIESEGLETELQNLVKQVWYEIEDQCRVQRKRRYQ
jgi:hypothetical protein